jgi:hypothetical protein
MFPSVASWNDLVSQQDHPSGDRWIQPLQNFKYFWLGIRIEVHLNHPIPNGRDSQWPFAAASLRDHHPSHGLWLIRLGAKVFPDSVQPFLQPLRLDSPEALPIHARRALIGLCQWCRLDGRFLVVRGDLHDYRIHIGSANVLMEPGSRYLCIVQGAGDTAAKLPLPFEGDRILGLVLSKALLLVNDKKIKDPAIARQLS